MSAPQITRAKLIPMVDGQPDPDTATHIEVQFNPANLRVTLSNTLKADNRGGGGATAQYVDKSESSLTVELLFDTSVARPGVAANTDVRTLTVRIADAFMKPQGDASRPTAPKICRFQWGRFQFTGMVSAYTETLDFFAPEGIPLRSTLALTLKENHYQYDLLQGPAAERRGLTWDWRQAQSIAELENPRDAALQP